MSFKKLEEAARIDASPWGEHMLLPLDDTDWGTTVTYDDLMGEEWPPYRLRPRQDRLELYHDLWRGDLRRVTPYLELHQAHVAAFNVFRRLAKFVADLMVREHPTAGGEAGMSDMALLTTAHSLPVNMIRYGGAVLVAAMGDDGPLVQAVDIRYAWPLAGGGWIVSEPRMSPGSTQTTPDVLQFTIIDDGMMVVLAREKYPTGDLNRHNLGPTLSAGVVGTDAEATVLPALPISTAGWGTSWFDDLLTIVIQVARRTAGNTRILDEHVEPLLLVRGALDRFTRAPGVPPSSAVAGDSDVLDEQEAIARLRRAGRLVTPDGFEDAEYIEWSGNLDASMNMLQFLMKMFRLQSSLPAVLDSDAEVPSGMSLRRMFWQFDASVAPLFHMCHDALSMAAEKFGLTLDWQNVFEKTDGTPVADDREDVEDEETARRGEGEPPEAE